MDEGDLRLGYIEYLWDFFPVRDVILQVLYIHLFTALEKILNSLTFIAYGFILSFARTTDLQLQTKSLIGKWAQSTDSLWHVERVGTPSAHVTSSQIMNCPTLLLYFWNTTYWKPTIQVERADAASKDTKLGGSCTLR